MALRPIFDLCAGEKGYEGRGKIRVLWRRQAAEEKKLRVMIEEILAEAREQRQQESGRRGKGEVEGEGTDRDR